MCNILATAWVIDYFIAFDVPIYNTIYKGNYRVRQQESNPRRPRGSQLSREKRRDESFQAQAEEPLGTDSHRTISKRSSECWLLIGHKKCFVLLCPIGEQHLLSSFREFVHDATAIDSITACLGHQTNARSQETFSLM